MKETDLDLAMWKPVAVSCTTEVSSVETCKCSFHSGHIIHAEQPVDPEHTSTLSVATFSPPSQVIRMSLICFNGPRFFSSFCVCQ